VQTTGAVHTATFETPQGIIRVHVPSDAAAGDTISGMIVVEPAGATPQARDANLGHLNALALEWQGQRTPVSGVTLQLALDMGKYVNSCTWRDDSPR